MHGAVISNECRQRTSQADHHRETCGRPGPIVSESKEDCTSVPTGSHDPEGNDNREETDQMENENEGLDKGKPHSQQRVEDNRKRACCNRKKGSVPCVEMIVRVVQSDQSLDDSSLHKTDTGEEDLPPHGSKPAWSLMSKGVRQS